MKIKIPYTITADISKYDGEVFNQNPSIDYKIQKEIEIAKLKSLGKQPAATLQGFEHLVIELCKYCGFEETSSIQDVARQLEEDVAILHEGRLVSISFCFPSGFDPIEKLGMSLLDMHRPVADNHKLQRASDKVVEMISKPGAKFIRNVWTLTTSDKLSRHPVYRSTEPPVNYTNKIYFRKEIQTMVGHEDGKTTFFFVKVEVEPLESLDNEQRVDVLKSINSMSEAVLEYKGLTEIKSVLNNKEKYNQIIDEAYENYINRVLFDEKDCHVDIKLNFPNKTFIPYSKEKFINKCKTDSEFSERWGLKIEERELSLEERIKIWKNQRLDRAVTKIEEPERLLFYFYLDIFDIPTKLITVTHNNETIEVYEQPR